MIKWDAVYHLTELRVAKINSIDCGGGRGCLGRSSGAGAGAGAGAGCARPRGDERGEKMTAILPRSVAEIDGLADAPLNVEFSPGNQGLGRYQFGAPREAEGFVTIPLMPMGPECKAMTRAFAKPARARNAAPRRRQRRVAADLQLAQDT